MIVTWDTASQIETAEGYEGRFEPVGRLVVGVERHGSDADLAPLFVGLPDDACQCPHWGVVIRGRLTYRYVDGTTETIEEGQAYYAPPGHTPLLHRGTEVVEFSDAEALAATMQVVTRNLGASAGAVS